MAESDQNRQELHDLSDMLERMEEAAQEKEQVSLGDILDATGRRSFGPLLLLAGLVTLTPLVGDIPGVPSLMGLIVILTAAQLLFHRDHFWLPRWLLDRSVAADKLRKGVGWLQKPARFIDRFLRPRLQGFVQGAGMYAIALVSAAIALMTPAMELVPFSANGAGLVLTAFGLALIARDGLLSLAALILAALTAGIIVYNLV